MRVCRIIYGPRTNGAAGRSVLLSKDSPRAITNGMLDYYFLKEDIARAIAKKSSEAHKARGIRYNVLFEHVESEKCLPKDYVIHTQEEFIAKLKSHYTEAIQELER